MWVTLISRVTDILRQMKSEKINKSTKKLNNKNVCASQFSAISVVWIE